MDKGEEMLTSGALGCAATAVHFSPDGARIAMGLVDWRLQVVARPPPPPALVLSGHAASLTPY